MPDIHMRPTVVIGLGNTLMSDEGIGVHLVRALVVRANQFPAVDFRELGTAGMAVLHTLAGRRKAVLLDCVRMNEPPGAIRRFNPDQVASGKVLPGFSLHEGDLLEILALSRRLGEFPGTVILFGIQPASLDVGDSLSPVLAARFEEYLRLIAAELDEYAS
ncbi:MAG: hydrogenase maturation protease [Verrucomicrobia bacterium]|nr:hydrogenase maturation protease [Verrucomicrobiota bacterium]MCG2680558.1 hydrogenase maturation protease [Kiritimatiellia bacterium]MBU4246882.1 hydrogenase maturation protease [Verrucomicrobiota bacterium]MBU4290839.1 hydrogenase maturation protease [Verrucomicrobiota bacterium]MBU4429248.1 hydrogenase maturation protease [Verrucomicrobiota bacterium]